MFPRAMDRYSFCYSSTVTVSLVYSIGLGTVTVAVTVRRFLLLSPRLIGLKTVTVSVTVSPSFPCLIGLRTLTVSVTVSVSFMCPIGLKTVTVSVTVQQLLFLWYAP